MKSQKYVLLVNSVSYNNLRIHHSDAIYKIINESSNIDMEKAPKFTLFDIRKGKRKHYPDYFITIHQEGSFDALISRERNKSVSFHYYDSGLLTFDNQYVDTFENIKYEDLEKLNFLGVPLLVSDYSGEFLSLFKEKTQRGKIILGSLLNIIWDFDVKEEMQIVSKQWFMDLLDTPKNQEFLRHNIAAIRYFHSDFDVLKDFLAHDSPIFEEGDSFFEEPHHSE